jgi:hypothetical protein
LLHRNTELQKFARSVDRFAARLNAGLSAVAVMLALLVLAEALTQLPTLYETSVAGQSVPLTSDPTNLVSFDTSAP